MFAFLLKLQTNICLKLIEQNLYNLTTKIIGKNKKNWLFNNFSPIFDSKLQKNAMVWINKFTEQIEQMRGLFTQIGLTIGFMKLSEAFQLVT